ncbi:MAG: hypothetical protein NTW03_12710 [Verrucomicrobia bacterium]|nr:hypothetical protein [Verrucomicrobiota bacterium]
MKRIIFGVLATTWRQNMRVPLFQCAVLFRLLPCWLLLTSLLVAADTVNNSLTQFQHAYQGTAEPRAKRDLVIKAIDDGVIKRGLSLVHAKVMFGDDLQTFRRDSTNAVLRAAVFFEPAKPPPNPLMSALLQGWYLDLLFSSDNRLDRYSLSNVHK